MFGRHVALSMGDPTKAILRLPHLHQYPCRLLLIQLKSPQTMSPQIRYRNLKWRVLLSAEFEELEIRAFGLSAVHLAIRDTRSHLQRGTIYPILLAN